MNLKHCALLAIVTLAVVGVVFSAFHTVSIEAPPPATVAPPIPAAPTAVSSLNVPVTAPIVLLTELTNDALPPVFSSEPAVQNDLLDITASWQLRRADVQLSVQGNQLRGRTTLTGSATLRGHAGPASVSEDIDFRGDVFLGFEPLLLSDWSLSAHDLQLSYRLDEATVTISVVTVLTRTVSDLAGWIPGVDELLEEFEKITEVPVSVRTLAASYLDPEIEELRQELAADVANLDILRPPAVAAWSAFCRVEPITEGLWLESKPVQFRAAQPELSETHLLAHLGLDIHLRILSDPVQPDCPFSDTLVIEPARPASIDLAVPSEINYHTLETALQDALVGESVGETVSIEANAITLMPDLDALLLAVDVTVSTDGWFDTRAAGTIYVWAVPTLSGDQDSIRLDQVRLDTASQNALVDLFGETAEPLILEKLTNFSFDLSNTYRSVESRGSAALNALSSNQYLVAGEIADIRVDTMHVGPNALHVVGLVSGELAVELQ